MRGSLESTAISAQAPRLLTVPETAQHFRVREATVQRWCREGRIRAIRHGKSWRIPIDALADAGDSPIAAEPVESPKAPRGPVGWHGLLLADHEPTMEDVFGVLPAHVAGVTQLRLVTFRLDAAKGSGPEAQSALAALLQAWERAIAHVSKTERVLVIVVGDPGAARLTETEHDAWEDHLTRATNERPLTIICARESKRVLGEDMDVWVKSLANHAAVHFRNRSSSFSMVSTATEAA